MRLNVSLALYQAEWQVDKEGISDPGRMNASSCEIEREMPGLLGDTTMVREVLESIIGPRTQTRQVQQA